MAAPRLTLGGGFTVPIDFVTQTAAIVGTRGRGKTSTAKVIFEEIVSAGQQAVVMDTVGAWWGVRTSLDGKEPGLPVVVFGGMHADVPLEDSAGALIAQVLIRTRVPAVIDLSGFRKAGQRRFATAFIEELYHSNREPMHVVFDEADEFAPQTPFPEGRQLLGAMEDFVRRGRIRGLGCTLVSQRPAVIHKDVLTQVETLITMGLTGPRDVAAINEWVSLHATEDQAKAVKSSLASLPTGTGWVWSPGWLGVLEKVAFRRVTTFDSSATPKVGQRLATPTARAEIDLDALGAEIAATVERAKYDDPKALRRRIADLEPQLAKKPAPVAASEVKEIRVEVPTLGEETLEALDERADQLEQVAGALNTQIEQLLLSITEIRAAVAEVREAHSPAPRARHAVAMPPTSPAVPPHRAALTIASSADGDDKLSKAQKAIATALATHGTLSLRQIGLHSGYAHKSGSFANNMSSLRTRGYIEGTGQAISITDAGLKALDANGGYDPLPTGRALVDWWMARLPKAQAAMLGALLEAYPDGLTAEQLGEATGYASGSGSFANNRSKLNVAELIHGDRNALFANDTLGEAYLAG
ncbi:ATP-binding protein [Microbacterium hominis]|uniref:ATP-binding protein n=1 Tax=Microbacterium hominis TaxID=162426 RepID=UPI0012FF218F|nr:type IV secretion system DNA-binding domain-containing protein [Microbacterium hominis]